MIYKFFSLLLFGLFSYTTNTHNIPASLSSHKTTTVETFELKVSSLYATMNPNHFKLPQLESFSKALKGFYKLQEKGLIKNNLLTLVDFSLSSNSKRLWIIDMNTNTILYHSLVAHGRNSGEEFATKFSNKAESFQSSLGFYITGEVYQGKHGKSLRLDGIERGINDKARDRAVVMHGADYVSEHFIKQNKRLGRSLGCPALPEELTAEIIELIKNQSCLFIYHPTKTYAVSSKLLS
jgi:hypothetical protein